VREGSDRSMSDGEECCEARDALSSVPVAPIGDKSEETADDGPCINTDSTTELPVLSMKISNENGTSWKWDETMNISRESEDYNPLGDIGCEDTSTFATYEDFVHSNPKGGKKEMYERQKRKYKDTLALVEAKNRSQNKKVCMEIEDDFNKEKERLVERIEDLTRQLNASTAERDALIDANTHFDESLADSVKKLDSSNALVTDLESGIDTMKIEVVQLKQNKTYIEKQMTDIMKRLSEQSLLVVELKQGLNTIKTEMKRLELEKIECDKDASVQLHVEDLLSKSESRVMQLEGEADSLTTQVMALKHTYTEIETTLEDYKTKLVCTTAENDKITNLLSTANGLFNDLRASNKKFKKDLQKLLNSLMFALTIAEPRGGPRTCAFTNITLLPSEPVFYVTGDCGCHNFFKADPHGEEMYKSFMQQTDKTIITCNSCQAPVTSMKMTNVMNWEREFAMDKLRNMTGFNGFDNAPKTWAKYNVLVNARAARQLAKMTNIADRMAKIKGIAETPFNEPAANDSGANGAAVEQYEDTQLLDSDDTQPL
jgi:hypothetical protein